MKTTLLIAVLALVGAKLISAAALNLDQNETPEAMKGLSENLKSWLLDISAQIKESAKSADDREAFERFFQKDNYQGDDAPTVIIEEEEISKPENGLSLVEDEEGVSEDVGEGDGVSCSWHGFYGRCCVSAHIYTITPRLCFIVRVHMAHALGVTFQINGHTLWHKMLYSHRNYRVCLHYHQISICNRFTNIYISLHYSRACVHFEMVVHHLRYRKFLGCISKHYSIEEENKDTKKDSARAQIPAQLFDDDKDTFFPIPKEKKTNDQSLRFQ